MWKMLASIAVAGLLTAAAVPAFSGGGCLTACSDKDAKVVNTASATDCAAKCPATSVVATGAAGSDCVQSAAAGCASKCSAAPAVATGAAGTDCVQSAAAGCASSCGSAAVVNAANTKAAGCCSSTPAVATGAAGEDHVCTGACGAAPANGIAGAAGSDLADGKTRAYRVGSRVSCFEAHHAQGNAPAALSKIAGEKATVLIFWNQNCPYVVEPLERIDAFAREFADKGVAVIGIDAGVNNSADSIKSHAADRPFPILINDDSRIAAMFAAARTPEVFILNADMEIVYHGAFDSGRENTPGSRQHYVRNAIGEMLEGRAPSVTQTRAFGCTIKYAADVRPLPTS